MDAHELSQEMLKLWSQQFMGAMGSGRCEPGTVAMIPVWARHQDGGKFKVKGITVDPDGGVVLELE